MAADMTTMSTPAFYTETLTLAEHQLLMRIRQLCKRDRMVVLFIEITNRDEVRAGAAMQELD